jgi:hypothetical protein
MTLRQQLRIYTINNGKMHDFVQSWCDVLRPLRLASGWRVDGGWVIEGESKFVWILALEGDEDWDTKNALYFNSPERKNINPDPSQWIAHIEARFIQTVLEE